MGHKLSDFTPKVQAQLAAQLDTVPRRRRSETKGEAGFQESVFDYATARRWAVWHDYDSRKNEPGFLDGVCLRGDRIVIIEFKLPGREPTAEQGIWRRLWLATGKAEVYVFTPDDWGRITEVLA